MAGRTDKQDTSRDVLALLALLNTNADAAKVLEATIELIGRQLAKNLGMSERMEPGKPLSGYGIDSLAAVEFRNWVRTELGREITTLEIVNAKTLASLCELIFVKMDPT
jgi:acyl carrier protein